MPNELMQLAALPYFQAQTCKACKLVIWHALHTAIDIEFSWQHMWCEPCKAYEPCKTTQAGRSNLLNYDVCLAFPASLVSCMRTFPFYLQAESHVQSN